jgi:hypothetical protein
LCDVARALVILKLSLFRIAQSQSCTLWRNGTSGARDISTQRLRISEVLHFGLYTQNHNIPTYLLISLYYKLQRNGKVRDLGEKNLPSLSL